MDWLNNNVPPIGQWLGLVATIFGTLFALWAALSAQSARKQAQHAKQAAIGLGRVVRLGDLLENASELEGMIARGNSRGIEVKCIRLQGRIVRFKQEAYNELSYEERRSLNNAQDQFRAIGEEAVSELEPRMSGVRRSSLQRGYAKAIEALNHVFANQRSGTQG